MNSWTERIELFFSPLYKAKEKTEKSCWLKSYFQKLQAHRLAEAERMLKDRMYYPGAWKYK
jgi:hypothetical protein